jgi:hypothetical protein
LIQKVQKVEDLYSTNITLVELEETLKSIIDDVKKLKDSTFSSKDLSLIAANIYTTHAEVPESDKCKQDLMNLYSAGEYTVNKWDSISYKDLLEEVVITTENMVSHVFPNCLPDNLNLFDSDSLPDVETILKTAVDKLKTACLNYTDTLVKVFLDTNDLSSKALDPLTIIEYLKLDPNEC